MASNPTPFEWLSGGLFFGNRGDRVSDIDRCKDPMVLLRGTLESARKLYGEQSQRGTVHGTKMASVATATITGINNKPTQPPSHHRAVSVDTQQQRQKQQQKSPSHRRLGSVDVLQQKPPSHRRLGSVDRRNQSNMSTSSNLGEVEEAEKLLAARLRRIRHLLYEERRESSQSDSPRKPTMAIKTMEGLTGSADPALVSLTIVLLDNLCAVPFEARKDVAAIFNYLLTCGMEGPDASVYADVMEGFRAFVQKTFDPFMTTILNHHHNCSASGGTESPRDVMLHAGSMYRSCLRHTSLYQLLVSTKENVRRFVLPFLDEFAHSPNFEVSSDAMETLRIVLTGELKHPNHGSAQASMHKITAAFLERDYVEIWDERFIPKLLADESSNYITRRTALKILSTVMLTKTNQPILLRFVASSQNLKVSMLLLRNNSPHITFDAFHAFKIFVANPNKPPEIVRMLSNNKDKLCRYLETLHKDKEATDTQIRDEKDLVIRTLQAL